ncbi:MAG: hypothetical protein KDA93_23975 [Planctomycetaceae bacterium]|nr:hypothetical protein [Planctomycetaceae bacterium]
MRDAPSINGKTHRTYQRSSRIGIRRPSSFTERLLYQFSINLQFIWRRLLRGVQSVAARVRRIPQLLSSLASPLNIAKCRYVVWHIGSKVLLGLVYFSIIAEGLRQLVPTLGQRLYKLPGLSFLQDYEATYRLDLAPIFAFFLLLAVWSLWGSLLKIWLLDDDSERYSDSHKLLISMLGCTILAADAYLFYTAVAQMGWSGSFSFSAIIATTAYVGVLIFVLYVSHQLREDVDQLRGI